MPRPMYWRAVALCMCVGCGTDQRAEGAAASAGSSPATGTDAGATSSVLPQAPRRDDAGATDGGPASSTTQPPSSTTTTLVPDAGRGQVAGTAVDAGDRPQPADSGTLPELDAGPLFDAQLGPDATSDAMDAMPDDGAVSEEADAGAQAGVIEKLRTCNVIGVGTFNQPSPRDALDRCRADCILSSDCQNIHAQLCEKAPLTTLSRCNTACVQAPDTDGFPCGDGTTVPYLWVCDQAVDCSNSADEQGCGTFNCANGQVLSSARLTCDGVKDCADGSDETPCASYCP